MTFNRKSMGNQRILKGSNRKFMKHRNIIGVDGISYPLNSDFIRYHLMVIWFIYLDDFMVNSDFMGYSWGHTHMVI